MYLLSIGSVTSIRSKKAVRSVAIANLSRNFLTAAYAGQLTSRFATHRPIRKVPRDLDRSLSRAPLQINLLMNASPTHSEYYVCTVAIINTCHILNYNVRLAGIPVYNE